MTSAGSLAVKERAAELRAMHLSLAACLWDLYGNRFVRADACRVV